MDIDLAAQPFDCLADDIQANAATGNLGDGGRRADAAAQQQADEILGARSPCVCV